MKVKTKNFFQPGKKRLSWEVMMVVMTMRLHSKIVFVQTAEQKTRIAG